jgi:hypothetical protein
LTRDEREESPVRNYVRGMRRPAGWLRVHARGRGLRRIAPLALVSPWNSKYRPVKAIPARRLNRPTNPLVGPTRNLHPTFLYIRRSLVVVPLTLADSSLLWPAILGQRRKYRYTSRSRYSVFLAWTFLPPMLHAARLRIAGERV